MNLLLAPECRPFLIALVLVAALSLVQVLALALGAGLDAVDADVDVDGDADGGALGWLGVGELPLSVWLIVFGVAFGAAGLLGQMALQGLRGATLPMWPATLAALAVSLPLTRGLSRVLSPLMPRDHSEAVSHESFAGCEGMITVGLARRGRPAEARVRDRFGRSHYVMVEPDADEAQFSAGSRVLLLRRDGDKWRVTSGVDVDG
jgi:hypothetical protein